MLFILHGDDNLKLRKKYQSMLDAILEKKPELSVIKLTKEALLGGALEELVSIQGLFEKQYVVLIDGLAKEAESGKLLFDKASELEESKNIFILIEEVLEKEVLSLLGKATKRIQEFAQGKSAPKEVFNTFALTDALGKRDRGALWVLYQKAQESGVSAEALHPLLFWQAKTMLLIASSKTGESTGLKPFVESKSRSFLKNYSKAELEEMLRALVSVYHNARRGAEDFEIGLERFMLRL